MSEKHQVLIIGGGTAGISVAARLLMADKPPKVTIIEPADTHYYQPLWTLVGGGVMPLSESAKPMAEVMPAGVNWIKDSVTGFDPAGSSVETAENGKIEYEHLVVAAGIKLDWDKVKGLKDALGKDGVTSNYSSDSAEYTWECIRNFKGGNAIFTFPQGPIKCAGAPQKIMWLAEDAFKRQGVRDASNVIYASATAGIFGIAKYAAALNKLVDSRGIDPRYKRNLTEIRAASKEAVFADLDGGEELVLKYDMIHVTPPQTTPDFIRNSELVNDAGWVDVDKFNMRHVKFPNIFSLGDCSSLPCSKTGAAVRKQAPALVDNLLAIRAHKPMPSKYDGYASCPLVTGYGRVILAEFGYDGKIMETFPFDQSQERFSMWILKRHALPSLYWHGMLKGRM